MCDAGGDFVEDCLLCLAERGFGKELVVLNCCQCLSLHPEVLGNVYSCCLEDFGYSWKIVDAVIENIDGVRDAMKRGLERCHR